MGDQDVGMGRAGGMSRGSGSSGSGRERIEESCERYAIESSGMALLCIVNGVSGAKEKSSSPYVSSFSVTTFL
jgi:hypothetical protein